MESGQEKPSSNNSLNEKIEKIINEKTKDDWIEFFKNKAKWANLFNTLGPEWSKHFLQDEDSSKWLALFKSQHEILLAKFSENKTVWKIFLDQNYFDTFPINPEWVEVFLKDEKSLKKITDQIDGKNAWLNGLNKNESWNSLFKKYPEQAFYLALEFLHSAIDEELISNWSELFLRKEHWIKDIAEKIKNNPGWLQVLCKNESWKEQSKKYPESAFVFAFELEQVNKRRGKTIGCANDLIGLALSGGGIRSATFGLGVLEALRDCGVLNKIDYLSTVSGGGYIGAWLSENCFHKGQDWLEPSISAKVNWTESIKYLRRYSNYLSPKVGLFSADTWTMATVWLRNTLMIQLTVIFGLACVLSIPILLYYPFIQIPLLGKTAWIPIILLFITATSGIAVNSWLIGSSKDEEIKKAQILKTGLFFGILAVIAPIIWDILGFNAFPDNPEDISWFWTYFLTILLVVGGFNLLRLLRAILSSYNKIYIIIFIVLSVIAIYIKTNGNIIIDGIIEKLNPVYLYAILSIVILVLGFDFKQKLECQFDKKSDYTQKEVLQWVILPLFIFFLLVSSILRDLSSKLQLNDIQTYGDSFSKALTVLFFPLFVVLISFVLISYLSFRHIDFNPTNTAKEDFKKIRNVFQTYKNNDSSTPGLSYIKTLFSRDLFVAFKETKPTQWLLASQIINSGKQISILLMTSIVPTIALYSMLAAILLIFHNWKMNANWMAFMWGPPLVLMAFSLSSLLLLGLLGKETIEGIREWWSRAGAWIAIIGIAWLVVSVSAIYGPLLGGMLLDMDTWKGLSFGGGWLGTTLAGVFAGKSAKSNGNRLSVKPLDIVASVGAFVFIVGLLILVSTGLHGIRANLLNQYWLNNPIGHWDLLSKPDYLKWSVCLLGITIILAVVSGWRFDINEFSLNAFYRSRLTRCYLGATRPHSVRNPQSFTGFDDDDDIDFSSLASSNQPYHIVNCTMNLGGSSDLTVHTRRSAIFTLSPLYCGSSYMIIGDKNLEVGYVKTKNYYEEQYKKPTLGQAIAISGAAVSPNRGYSTSSTTSFLMTLFNVRLGWWFPNPHNPNIKKPSPESSLKYLAMELFGLANERSDFLSISDGGHFENLAAYELVKRKCKLIIISDAECDPEYKLEGLGILIRMCEVDFGTTININVDQIKPKDESNWSDKRFAIGTIDYKDNEADGILIYIKASMNSHEKNTAVMQYKWAHQNFPHETTADQFYREDQFESYRSLGNEITKEMFEKNKIQKLLRSTSSKLSTKDIIHYADKLNRKENTTTKPFYPPSLY